MLKIKDIKEIAKKKGKAISGDIADEVINNFLDLYDIAILARGFVNATIAWNKAITELLGRQPRTGIPIEELDKALKKIEKLS